MKNGIAVALKVSLIFFLIGLSGCYTFHVYQIGGPEGREQGNQPGTEWQEHPILRSSFLWGAIRQDLPIEMCRLVDGTDLGIEEVEVRTNFGFVIASFLTLGMWVPITVNWRCGRPPIPTGTL